MKHYYKIGPYYINLDDLKEENWSPFKRLIIYWLTIAGVAITFLLIGHFSWK
jgi:hypothetical protein